MEKVYLQMYSFMDGGKYDSKENFRKAAEMGYFGVELFGPNFEIPPVELKAYLDSLNLEAISMHAPGTDSVIDMIPYAKAAGVSIIGIGMEMLANGEDAHRFAEKLNEIGKTCAQEGISLVYHNHTHEFLDAEGKRIIDILMVETNPEYANFELDAGWCAAAGYDPIELIRQYAGRIKLVHLKESDQVLGPSVPLAFDQIPKDENGMPLFTEEQLKKLEREKSVNCMAGEGIVNWTELKKVADAQGCLGYIVERELTVKGTREECLQADLDYYKTC